jgi:SAM-dependent methyltransferase
MSVLERSAALPTYEALAPAYDAFTSGYDHETWLRRIRTLARSHGLRGRRVLDVACGTGKSAAPMLARGYEVTACDVSPRMAAIATRRLGAGARVLVADMRDLPPALGSFALVTCLDDAINYLDGPDDLEAAFHAAARVLDRNGLYVFDVNTLGAYRESYAHVALLEVDGAVFCWRGDLGDAPREDGPHEAQLDAFLPGPDGRFDRILSRHHQRHFGDATVRRALAAAGLDCVDVVAQRPGVRFDRPPADDDFVGKRLYVARPVR